MAESISIYKLWRSQTDYLHVRVGGVIQKIDDDFHWRVRDWIEENCEGKYTNNGSKYDWFFELESDAFAFKLRWA